MEPTRPDAQQYLVQLLEQAPVGVVRLDAEGAVASANPAACELLDQPERALISKPFGSLFEDSDTIGKTVMETLATGEGTTVVTRRGPTESGRHLELNVQRFRAEGTGAGAMVILQDVTARVSVERQREELLSQVEFLAETSSRLGSSIDFDEVFDQLAEIVIPLLADWCALDVMEGGTVRRVGVSHADPEKAELCEALKAYRPDAANRTHPVVRALVREKPVLISDVDAERLREVGYDEEHTRILTALGLRSAMVVPMVARRRLLGTLTLVSATNPKRYGATQLVLAQDVASRAALALDNARLLSEHVDLARKLQQSLLPPTIPSIPELELAARYQPAAAGIDVGGDFYDFFQSGPKSWSFVVGDVSGKGADAAVVTTLARYTIRAAAMKARAPRRILGLLNDAIYDQTDMERFATVAYVRVRTDGGPGSKKIVLACGGHPLPLVLRADGTIDEIGTPGTALGLLKRVEIKDASAVLQPGDALVLFTDGVTEARVGDHMLGIHGLRTALVACRGRSAQEMADALARTALDFQKENQKDDMAIVVLRVPDIEA